MQNDFLYKLAKHSRGNSRSVVIGTTAKVLLESSLNRIGFIVSLGTGVGSVIIAPDPNVAVGNGLALFDAAEPFTLGILNGLGLLRQEWWAIALAGNTTVSIVEITVDQAL